MLSRSLIKNGDWIIDPFTNGDFPIYEIVNKETNILRDVSGRSFYGNLSHFLYVGPKLEVDRLIKLVKLCYSIQHRIVKIKYIDVRTITDVFFKDANKKITEIRQKEYENDLSGSGKEKSYTITL